MRFWHCNVSLHLLFKLYLLNRLLDAIDRFVRIFCCYSRNNVVIMKFIHEIYTSRCSGHRHKLSQEMQMLTLNLDFLGYAWYGDLLAEFY